MRSMTGFGKGEAADNASGVVFTVEISTVNRKQLEIRPNLPREIAGLESLLRKLIAAEVSRGAVMARVNIAMAGDEAVESVRVNQPRLEKLLAQCVESQRKLNLSGDISVATLMTVPGVVEAVPPDIESPLLRDIFKQAAQQAVAALVAMREQEGGELRKDFAARIDSLEKTVNAIEPLAAAIPERAKEKLLTRLAAENLPVDVNDERVLKEVVIYADKSDVTEELTRLRSHFVQFREFLSDRGGAPGRSMDFLAQEMFREITTLGNKAAGSAITPLVVLFKTELEKIREQTQNVE